jgi:hypothetical protein
MSSGHSGRDHTRTDSPVPTRAVRQLVDNVMRSVHDDRERERAVHVEPKREMEYIEDDRRTNWGAF